MRKRSKWFAAAVVVGLVGVMPATLRQLSRDRPVPPKVEPPSERVRVEHEVVTADVIEPMRVVSAGAATMKGSSRAVVTPRRALMTRAAAPTAAPVSTTFREKARRAFLGDGRHRPQPFPTVR
jgi:hypothetical protein